MPLRDHFHPPLDDETSWEGLHGGWPMMIVAELAGTLPARYVAGPHIHAGASAVIDAANLSQQDEYEVRVYDQKRKRRLVAAIEIVSPANKDRPEHRRAFVAKCVALLQNQVAVIIIDLVTSRGFNLYAEMLDVLGLTDSWLAPQEPPLYAVACRPTLKDKAWHFEAWTHALVLGDPLPTLPLWLAEDLAVPLELEPSYEKTCRLLRLPTDDDD